MKIKYKLIREYPGSPKLGYILPFDKETNQYKKGKWNYTIHEIENNPEFWQKIKPLFITEDKKNIYEGMEYWYYSTIRNCFMKNKAIPNGLGSIYEILSTKQAIQDYLAEQIAKKKGIEIGMVVFDKTTKRRIGTQGIKKIEYNELEINNPWILIPNAPYCYKLDEILTFEELTNILYENN